MHQYRDESDDIRVTKTVRVARSNVPIDVDGLKRRISEKIDAEIQAWAKEYFGYGGDNT